MFTEPDTLDAMYRYIDVSDLLIGDIQDYTDQHTACAQQLLRPHLLTLIHPHCVKAYCCEVNLRRSFFRAVFGCDINMCVCSFYPSTSSKTSVRAGFLQSYKKRYTRSAVTKLRHRNMSQHTAVIMHFK